MDIKGLVRNIIPLTPVNRGDKASEAGRAHAKTDANNDREGNGQASQGEEQKKRPLTLEELQDAVTYLESLAGVKDNGLRIRVEARDGVSVVYIEDRDGKVVRRIPESELSALTANRDKKSGHLINKAM